MAQAQAATDRNVANFSNSKDLENLVFNSAKEMAEIDAQRKKLNEQAADIREVLKERGIDRDAFKDVYGYFKKGRYEKEGYDESNKLCFDALNRADTADLFAAD